MPSSLTPGRRPPVVPSEDAHSSEYIARCDARREFICGFSGSAGCAVVTRDKAAMATDGRYFNQAGRQLDANWELLKQGLPDVPTWQEWAAQQSAGGKVVAVDPTLLSSATAKKLGEKIKQHGGADLVPVAENLVDLVWSEGRPARTPAPVKLLPAEFSGKDTKTKLAELREELKKKKAPGFVVSVLDEIAWLFNLRGSDIPYNPVFFSYAVVTSAGGAWLFVDPSKLGGDCRKYLEENGVTVRPYETLFDEVRALSVSGPAAAGPGDQPNGDKGPPQGATKVLMSTRGSWALKLALGGDAAVDEIRSPVGDAKAIKNATELEGMRRCHIRDGAALIEYFAWLEDQLLNAKAELDEVAVAGKLEQLRSKHEHYVGLSFDTISSTGAK